MVPGTHLCFSLMVDDVGDENGGDESDKTVVSIGLDKVMPGDR